MFKIDYRKDPTTGKSVKVMIPVTSEQEYREQRNSERNLTVLNNVRGAWQNYISQQSSGAEEAVLRQLKDAYGKEKGKLVQFVYSCIPGPDGLLKGCTQESPWVGSDIDFDTADPLFEQKMAEAPQRIIAMADQLGLGMLESSAGKGYHIAFRRHLDLDQEGNLRWASQLIGCKYDEAAKDKTRVFYSTSASPEDLLYLSSDMFLPEANQPVIVTAQTDATKSLQSEGGGYSINTPAEATPNIVPDPSAQFYQGIPFSKILEKYNEMYNDGKVPTSGDHNRNTWTYEWAQNVRCIRDFSVELVMQVTPIYDGFPREEWKKCIESACSLPRKGMTYRMRQVLNALKTESGNSPMPWGLTTTQPPLLTTRMPESLRKFTAPTPRHLKNTVSEGGFSSFSSHLHGVTFENIDGKIVEPAIMQTLIARQSSGKQSVDEPIACANEDLANHDAADRIREDEHKLNNPPGATKRTKCPEDIYIQTCQSDMTNAGFVRRLIQCNRNGERPVFIKMEELDEITALSTNGKNDVTRIIRKAFDRSPYGQERAGSDSVSGVAPCRLNFMAATTPVRAVRMCSPWAADGTLSRVNLLTIDPNDGNEPIKYKAWDQRYKDSIRPYIERLNNASGLIRCKKAYKLAERLRDQLEDEYARTNSEAIRTFAPRAVTIAYWKAMILYIMEGKWTKDIENYVEWSLKRDMWCKLHFFGKKMEDDLDAETKLDTFHPKNILDTLGGTFTWEEFVKARQQLGLTGDPKEHMKKLRQRKQVDYDDTNDTYIKIAKNNA